MKKILIIIVAIIFIFAFASISVAAEKKSEMAQPDEKFTVKEIPGEIKAIDKKAQPITEEEIKTVVPETDTDESNGEEEEEAE